MLNIMWSNNSPRRYKPLKVLFFLAAALVFALLLGTVVMLLWNAILPDLTGVNEIKLWQAIGLLVLSRILFGGFHWGKHRGRWNSRKSYWREKWMHMSHEEKSAFKERWRERCGKAGEKHGQSSKED